MNITKVFRIFAAAFLIALALFILHRFLAAVAWAVVIAVATWPWYERFLRFLPETHRSAFGPGVFTLIIAAIILVPLGFGLYQAWREAAVLLHTLADSKTAGLPAPGWLENIPLAGLWLASWWQQHLAGPGDAAEYLNQITEGHLRESVRAFGAQALHRAAILGFALLTLFFLFRDGKTLAGQSLRAGNQLLGEVGERYALHTMAAVRATVNGLVFVGVVEGVLMWIAYWLAGLPHAALLGAMTGLAGMIPFAAPILFAGVALVLFAQGATVAATGLLVFGILVFFIADHLVRPALIGASVKLHFLWVLLGILGGLETIGLLGLFLGPAIMAAFVSLWRDLIEAEVAPSA